MVHGPGGPRAARPPPPAGQGYAAYGVGVPSDAPQAAGDRQAAPLPIDARRLAAGAAPGRVLAAGATPALQAGPAGAAAPVTLHIYDVSNKRRVRFANNVLGLMGSGAYHAAVEVYGREWSYGWKAGGSGVFSTTPGGCQAHHYRKPIPMGNTECTQDQAMGLEGLPRWVMSLAASGTKLQEANHLGYEARSGSPDGHTGYGDLPRGLLELGRSRREEVGGWRLFDFTRGIGVLCGCE
ncbi:unnamed protein product [Prorocentrum cordatum]|uniref:PPPDE domain-containing protein n=1 Tax=Prorocentrum cordatum TaxID=2364126 RepID=A0ABN9W0W9_9DINO|nr:unnamed protein product [Polarella glacialis]